VCLLLAFSVELKLYACTLFNGEFILTCFLVLAFLLDEERLDELFEDLFEELFDELLGLGIYNVAIKKLIAFFL